MSNFDFQALKIEKESDSRRGFNLSALAVRERSVTLFFLLAIIIAGAAAYLNLGRAEDPTFRIKVFTVTAAWPGATAEEMQNLVAEPLEKRLQELKYYYHVDTFTRPGLAFLTVTLRDYTPPDQIAEEFYQGRKKVQDEASKLPKGVLAPVLNDEYTDVVFAVYALKGHEMPLRLACSHPGSRITPPGAFACLRRQKGQHIRRAARTYFRGILLCTHRDTRSQFTGHLRRSGQAERGYARRLDRHEEPAGLYQARRSAR